MLYLAAGLILGVLLNLLPLWQPSAALELHPRWHGAVAAIDAIEPSPDAGLSKIGLAPVVTEDAITVLSGAGTLIKKQVVRDRLFSAARGGERFVTYEKAGSSIEYFGMGGDRFWKIDSREYPYISYNGKMVLLLTSDHSALRIFDFNGNPLGAGQLSGRFVTVISFAENSDNAAVGFLDGAYYLFNGRGEILYQGIAPGGSPVKSAAVSPGGAFGAVHFGGEKQDAVIIIDALRKKTALLPLGRVHLAKTALHADDDGTVAVLDYNRILIAGRRGKVTRTIPVPPAKTGMASLTRADGLVMAAYTRREGDAQMVIFTSDGLPLYAQTFPLESYLELSLRGPVILLRGSHNLYCYSLSAR